MDFGEPQRQGTVYINGDRADLVQGVQLLKAVNHPLGSPQAERRDDDLALEPRGSGDDRVQLLHQAIVRIELAITVGALGDQYINALNRSRIGKEVGAPAAQVAGEDESAWSAVLAEIELKYG